MQEGLQEVRMMRSRFAAAWRALPTAIRRTIVLVIGFTLIILGLLLVVLPGPFTLPLVILGLFVLAIEFAWADRMLDKVKAQGKKVDPRKFFKKH
jgi:drug/metabolite transporter (DMT)-like permease